jgi:putative endonuclease
MTKYNKKTGNFGEKIAVKYLKNKGYQIIGQNKQISHLEIDILAKFKGKLVFIEVKARTNTSFEDIVDGLSSFKLKNLKRAINRYIYHRNIDPDCVQLDLLAIKLDYLKKMANIKHYTEII